MGGSRPTNPGVYDRSVCTKHTTNRRRFTGRWAIGAMKVTTSSSPRRWEVHLSMKYRELANTRGHFDITIHTTKFVLLKLMPKNWRLMHIMCTIDEYIAKTPPTSKLSGERDFKDCKLLSPVYILKLHMIYRHTVRYSTQRLKFMETC